MWMMYSYCWSFLNLVIHDVLVFPCGTPGCRMSGCRNAYKPRFKNAGKQRKVSLSFCTSHFKIIVKLDVHKCESYVDIINIRNWWNRCKATFITHRIIEFCWDTFCSLLGIFFFIVNLPKIWEKLPIFQYQKIGNIPGQGLTCDCRENKSNGFSTWW